MTANSPEGLVAFLPEGDGDGSILLLHIRTFPESLKKFIFVVGKAIQIYKP